MNGGDPKYLLYIWDDPPSMGYPLVEVWKVEVCYVLF